MLAVYYASVPRPASQSTRHLFPVCRHEWTGHSESPIKRCGPPPRADGGGPRSALYQAFSVNHLPRFVPTDARVLGGVFPED